MTDAREPGLPPLQFVGVDMAQEVFEWAVHEMQGTHRRPIPRRGLRRCWKRSRTAVMGLIVIEATGGLERRAGRVPVAPRSAGGGGQPPCRTRVRAQHGAFGQDRRH